MIEGTKNDKQTEIPIPVTKINRFEDILKYNFYESYKQFTIS